MSLHRSLAPMLCLCLLAAGCSSGDGNNGVCGDLSRVDDYVPGLTKDSIAGRVSVRMQSAEPSPPDRGDNSWQLAVTDPGGTPVSDATVIVSPFMPDHGHGTVPENYTAMPNGAAGTYDVPEIDLFMPGFWEITVRVIQPSGESDETIFGFCIEG